MTTHAQQATFAPEPETPTDADAWQFGWRYIPRETPYGTAYDRVPLTLDDVLNPQEGDQVVQSEIHLQRCTYLYNVFRAQLANDSSAAVLSDVLIRWDVPDLRPDAPDIAVITGIREQHTWNSFDVAAEGVRPALVIEIVSPHSRFHDLANRTDDYYDAGVPVYIIIDFSERRTKVVRRLLGYQSSLEGYLPMQPNERGWLWLESVGLWLGIDGDNLECYDRNEQPIEDYPALAAARDAAEERVETERQARLEVEQRIALLEAELQRLREA